MKGGIVHFREEVGIFEIGQNCQVDNNAQNEIEFPFRFLFSLIDFHTGVVTDKGSNDEENQEKAGSFVVKQHTHEEKESVSQLNSISYESKNGKNNRKKCPKIELGK